MQLFTPINTYLKPILAEVGDMPHERREILQGMASWVRERSASGQAAELTFICTHNSRRSHFAQVWAQTAAAYYGIPGVTAYSGGTETTACNPRSVAALRRAGFTVDQTTEAVNPIYHLSFSSDAPPLTLFSKVYNAAPNPSENYCAVMTCTSADANCPAVFGSSLRLAMPYEDPKAYDGTDRESEAYDERCRQIGREMLYAFSKV